MYVTVREFERSNLFHCDMPLRVQGSSVAYRLISLVLSATAVAVAASPPIPPVTVCEVLENLAGNEGKEVAVLGRFSFRRDGRWIGEQSCDASAGQPPLLWLSEDSATAPRPPADFELDAGVLNKKFAAMTKKTALGKFKFGTPDYDRWAVVYGRIVARKADGEHKAAANLVFRGDGVVVFLTTEK